MARDDNEIKGEIIGELEDIEDPSTGKTLLDALMVERVEVAKGQVTIDLVFEDGTSREARWDLENEIQDAIEDIEGIEDIDIFAHTRSAMVTEAAAPEDVASAVAGGASSVPDEEASSSNDAPADEASGANLSVYSGGGCSAGTVSAPVKAATPAQSAPSGAPAAAKATTPAPVAVSAVGDGQQVVLSLADYTRLVQAERDAQLRPSVEEHNALKAEHRILTARVASLQDAVRALLRGVEAEA